MTDSSDRHIRHVLVVGGGTAGWLAACHLARVLKPASGGVQVTLLESENIPTIGVGEGTVPAIRASLQHLGISETEFVRECDVTFKQGIKFVDWVNGPAADGEDAYHHIFDYPISPGADLTPWWLMGTNGDQSYVDAVSVQGGICDAGLAPKTITHAEYDGAASYAYHLDAAKFAAFLTRHATGKLGVRHMLADVTDVNLDNEGYISSVSTEQLGEIEADLFVDCTGFRSLLLGEALGVGFRDMRDTLFVDHAVAAQVPYEREDSPIPSYTIATAKEAGWIWDIGLTGRRGTGYVYSSRYTDHDQAEAVLREYLGSAGRDVATRLIPMKVGYRESFWEKNCVAIGMSAGFVEPLEATGLLVFDACSRMLAEQFPPHFAAIPAISRAFNRRVRTAWDRVIDFIKLHYYLSKRNDSEFWIDNRKDVGTPAELLERLELWRHQVPAEYDFSSKLEIFNLPNYLYVLYGMEFETDMGPLAARYQNGDAARQGFEWVGRAREQALAKLPSHRDLIERIHKYGLQKR